jgi:hypothetical protein
MMADWLYQMSHGEWPVEEYREQVWEGEVIHWPWNRVAGRARPVEGDLMVCWYARSGSVEPGMYGWGVVVRSIRSDKRLRWRPAPPSDYLKMRPLFDKDVQGIIDAVRGRMRQGTMWPIGRDHMKVLRAAVHNWTRT